MEKLPISVIVITKNVEMIIDNCLDSVKKNNPAEIVIVDGNSSDRTVEIARGYTDRILSDGGKGKSFARQLGAEKAIYEYIAYVDADVTLTNGALEIILREFQDSSFIAINARLENPPSAHSSYWERGASYYLGQLQSRKTGLATAACLMKRETVMKYGFELGYGGYIDDYSLELRLRKDGHTFGISSAVAYHKSRDTFQSFWNCWYILGKVTSYKVRKYGSWHAGFWPPLVMLYWIVHCLIRGKFRMLPYFIFLGIAETAGMARGFFDVGSKRGINSGI